MQFIKEVKRKLFLIGMIFLSGEVFSSKEKEEQEHKLHTMFRDNLIREEDVLVLASYMAGEHYDCVSVKTKNSLSGVSYEEDGDLYRSEFVRQLTYYVNMREEKYYDENFVMLVYRMISLLDDPEECIFAPEASFCGLTPAHIDQGIAHLLDKYEEYFTRITSTHDGSYELICGLIAASFFDDFMSPSSFGLNQYQATALYNLSYIKMLQILGLPDTDDDQLSDILAALNTRRKQQENDRWRQSIRIGLYAMTAVAGCSVMSMLFFKAASQKK